LARPTSRPTRSFRGLLVIAVSVTARVSAARADSRLPWNVRVAGSEATRSPRRGDDEHGDRGRRLIASQPLASTGGRRPHFVGPSPAAHGGLLGRPPMRERSGSAAQLARRRPFGAWLDLRLARRAHSAASLLSPLASLPECRPPAPIRVCRRPHFVGPSPAAHGATNTSRS
jgi:hypothetical protein